MRKILVGLIILLALAGCNKGPNKGTVFQKEIGAAYTWYMPICMYQGKYGCLIWYQMPMHEPERYYVMLVSQQGEFNNCQVDLRRYDIARWGENFTCDLEG